MTMILTEPSADSGGLFFLVVLAWSGEFDAVLLHPPAERCLNLWSAVGGLELLR